jgi:hypothetical protein
MKANFKKHVSSGKYEEALKLILNYDFVSYNYYQGSWKRKRTKREKAF